MGQKFERKDRNSSFELLRLLSMVLILAHHYSFHGGYEPFTAENLNVGRIYLQILSLFGRSSCSIFAMISGYHLIDSCCNRHHYRKIVVIGAEMLFYSISIFLFAYFTKIIPVSVIDAGKALLSVIKGNWFVVGYLCLYALVPFLNPILLSLDKRKYQQILFVILITYSIIPTFHGTQNYGTLGFFVVMYLLGAYVKLYYNNDFSYDNKYNLIIGLGCAFCIILLTIVCDILGIYFKKDFLISHITYYAAEYFFITLLASFFIFVYFSNLEFSSKHINYLASTTLGVYLIHDNDIMRQILWRVISPNANFVNSPFLHSLIKISIVFSLCVIIDTIRAKTLGKWFNSWLNKHADNIWNSLKFILHK